MTRSKLLLLIILIFASPIVYGRTVIEAVNTSLLSKNQSVPNFKFEISKGKFVSINDYKGKIVLINFLQHGAPHVGRSYL